MANSPLVAGLRFDGPDGQSYVLQRDINGYDIVWAPGNWKPEGGAPEMRIGDKIPGWLFNAIRDR